jgi:hypothetical protein
MFCDLEGAAGDPEVIARLRTKAESVRLLDRTIQVAIRNS